MPARVDRLTSLSRVPFVGGASKSIQVNAAENGFELSRARGAGTSTIDFGAFPGKTDTSLAVTGQAAIVAGSVIHAQIRPVATADHSADEHWIEEMDVAAGNIVAATGFTLYAKTRNKRLYGQYTIGWMWG